MTDPVQISIVIINFNTFELTCSCIRSIKERTLGLNYEIILVDNASTEKDPSAFIACFPEIKLIASKENLGFAKGNNLGIQAASGEVILLLNSDTELMNDAIGLCYSELLKNVDIGVITCRMEFPNGEIQHQCRRFETLGLYWIEKLRLHKLWSPEKRAEVLLNGYFDHRTAIRTDRIWGTFFMFKRSILESFPENKLADRFFMYGEDNEWCYQLRTYTPLHILYYPEARIIHYGGASDFNASASDAKQKAIKANKRMYMSDYYGKFKTALLLRLKGE